MGRTRETSGSWRKRLGLAGVALLALVPTLQTLIARGQRLVVFAEEKGGLPPWYMPAFSFIQDTPLGATRPDQLSCKR